MLETLTVLGGGGWFPAHGRQTASALMRDPAGESGILIDAGTGVGRLIERPDLLDGLERLDIVLTHFHLDHIAGLAYLPAIGVCQQTTVWGPGQLLYGQSTASLLDRISREPFHPVPLEDQDIDVRDLPGGEIELGATRLVVRRQLRHSAPTIGLRFGDALAWITDTAYEEDSARFAKGCALLAHEAWYVSAAPRNEQIHSSALQAARVAELAEIEQLVLIHLPPFTESLQELQREAQSLVSGARLAHDSTAESLQLA